MKGFEIKGTFLDKDVKQESLAEALIKGFDKATILIEKYRNSVEMDLGLIIDEELSHLSNLLITYYFKYLYATIITKWYWKRKYEKTIKKYEELIKYKKE